MRKTAMLALGCWLTAAAGPFAAAQSNDVSARIGQGRAAKASATIAPSEGVTLEFALPDGRTQSFPRLGEQLVALDGTASGRALVALDIDRDGVDEIFLRGLVPPKTGAVVGFRWNAATGEFEPIDFTNDRDRTTKFLVVDAALPVVIDPSGTIEAQYMSERQDGRKSYHVARFRWTGKGYSQSADN